AISSGRTQHFPALTRQRHTLHTYHRVPMATAAKDFPPKSTTHDYFVELHCTGVLTTIHHALYATVRELEGKDPTPTLAIVDSQTVKSAEKGGQRLIRPDMTRARKSRARSDTRPSIRSVS